MLESILATIGIICLIAIFVMAILINQEKIEKLQKELDEAKEKERINSIKLQKIIDNCNDVEDMLIKISEKVKNNKEKYTPKYILDDGNMISKNRNSKYITSCDAHFFDYHYK